jgi:hypothetical protein
VNAVDAAALKEASRSIVTWTGAMAQSAYFARECHEAYAAIGFENPIAGEWRGRLVNDPITFHATRAALLGEVPGLVASAVFPHMSPALIEQAVTRRNELCDAATLVEARQKGAVAQLRRLLGEHPAGIERLATIVRAGCNSADVGGRPFAAALLALGWTGDPLADAWHGSEVLRELRGDAHVSAWLGRGLQGPQAHILFEYWLGIGGCGLRRVWGWTAVQLDQAEADLVDRGLVWEGELTPAGRALRDEIEDATDDAMLGVMRAIADELDDLARIAEPLSRAVVTGKGSLVPRPSYSTWLTTLPAYQFG